MTSEWLLHRANSAIYQLYSGENKLINDDGVHFVLDQHVYLEFCSAMSLKHVTPFGHSILLPS
jgi:hypothetical protein